MSSTLVPPNLYAVGLRGMRPQLHRSIASAAWALVCLPPQTAAVSAVTGKRQRPLTEVELRELGRHVHAWRVSGQIQARLQRAPATTAPADG